MANRAYSTPIHSWAFHLACTMLTVMAVPALLGVTLLGLATPDPIISGRAPHTQEAAQ
jgi:hypothetical protein